MSKQKKFIVNIIICLVILISLIEFAFLVRWQLLNYQYFKEKVNARLIEKDKYGLRGKIISSDNQVLAYSEVAYSVAIYKPKFYKILSISNNTDNELEIIRFLSANLNLAEEVLSNKLNDKDSINLSLGILINQEQKNKLEQLKYKDFAIGMIFDFTRDDRRIYPNNSLASNILGYIKKNGSSDNVLGGIELSNDGELKPQKGNISFSKDAKGREIFSSDSKFINEQNGYDIKLTINANIQRILETNLKNGFEKFKPESISGVILNPINGKIIAMGQYPDLTSTLDKDNGLKYLNNINISDTYEPGSVGKIFTLLSGIDKLKVQASTMLVKSHNGCMSVKGSTQNWDVCVFGKERRSNITVENMIYYSDNIGAYTLAKMVGVDNFKKYLEKFGIGNSSNLGIAGEATSIIDYQKKWYDLDLWSSSFGQSYSLTTLQLASAVASLANDCKRLRPRLVDDIYYSSIKVSEYSSYVEDKVCDEESLIETNSILSKNFQYYVKNSEFSSLKSDINKYHLGGKTGTAQIYNPIKKVYEIDGVNTTFVGFDTSESKSFVMVIRLNKPQERNVENTAGITAFPVWMNTFLEIKDIIGIKKYE